MLAKAIAVQVSGERKVMAPRASGAQVDTRVPPSADTAQGCRSPADSDRKVSPARLGGVRAYSQSSQIRPSVNTSPAAPSAVVPLPSMNSNTRVVGSGTGSRPSSKS